MTPGEWWCESLENMKTSHKIAALLCLILLTNFVTFILSSSFQKLAKFDEDDYNYHIYDSLDYEHSYSYTAYGDITGDTVSSALNST